MSEAGLGPAVAWMAMRKITKVGFSDASMEEGGAGGFQIPRRTLTRTLESSSSALRRVQPSARVPSVRYRRLPAEGVRDCRAHCRAVVPIPLYKRVSAGRGTGLENRLVYRRCQRLIGH